MTRKKKNIKHPDSIAWPALKGNEPDTRSWLNTVCLLRHEDILCRYNQLKKQMELTGEIFNDPDGILSNDSKVTFIHSLASQEGFNITRSMLENHLAFISNRCQYSPVADYLNVCYEAYRDTGYDPIHHFFERLKLSQEKDQDPEFCELLFRKWLIGCARIAFNKGEESMESLIVLQGPQGIGKSRFLRLLVPNPAWASKSMVLDPANKDNVIDAAGFWLVELGEIGSTLKKDMDRLKAYLSASKDTVRRPYAKSSETLPRTTAFIGSTNEDRFLKDYTGNRRFWVISVSAIDDTPMSLGELSELWGYVMHLVRDKDEPHYLSKEELEKQMQETDQNYRNITNEEQLIYDSLDWEKPAAQWREYRVKELSEHIGLGGSKLAILGKVLCSMAKRDQRIHVRGNDHHGRFYLLPPALPD